MSAHTKQSLDFSLSVTDATSWRRISESCVPKQAVRVYQEDDGVCLQIWTPTFCARAHLRPSEAAALRRAIRAFSALAEAGIS